MTVDSIMRGIVARSGLHYLPRAAAAGAAMLAMSALAGCSTYFSHDGPRYGAVAAVQKKGHEQGALLVDLTDASARQVSQSNQSAGFLDMFGQGSPYGALIGPGDTLQVSIFEAPPAVLFSSGLSTSTTAMAVGLGGSSQRGMTLPDMQVDAYGQIDVPFAGRVDALGKTPRQVSAQIVRRLRGKAHDPQAVVSIARGASSVVTVVGEVAAGTRMPLTAKGERLLDALAAAGGSRQPVDKVSVLLARGGKSAQMPLDALIANPGQNIFLQPGDVVTVSYQPASFTALGAAGRNEEIKFEARGISLAQALGRMGGLRDDRANPRGVFVFRLEKPDVLGGLAAPATLAPDADGNVPVIYRLDMRTPVSFFTAQHFSMKDHDIVFVTNSPIADLQKFVNIIGASVYPIVAFRNAGN